MKNLHKMTKEELIAVCKRLHSENERLSDELDNLSDYCSELENQCTDAINSQSHSIKDIRMFTYRLMTDGLLTSELEDFIEMYMKYYNERMGD